MTGTARLKPIALPDYGVPRQIPKIAAETYQARFARFMDRIAEKGLDAAVVYADREHCANISWLTGFDPRFEEALLIAVRGKDPVIITGPENVGLAAATMLGTSSLLWPGFGLLGQDRTKSASASRPAGEGGAGEGTQDRCGGLEVLPSRRGCRSGQRGGSARLCDGAACRHRTAVVNATGY